MHRCKMPLRASKPKGGVMTISFVLGRETPYPYRRPLATSNPLQAKMRIAEVTGEPLDIERVMSGSERGRWKSAGKGNSLAAYSTARTVLRGLRLASAYSPAVCNGGPDKAEPAVRYRVLRRVR